MIRRIRIRRGPTPGTLFVLLTAVAAAGVSAQPEFDVEMLPPTIELSFSNPGARSMGFGGAFVALADDATAAFANPAGLVQIVEPEVSIEGRYRGYSTPHVAGGRIFGTPTGIGLDSFDSLRMDRSSEDLGGLSFLSVVYPQKRWALAFYRHQLASFEFYGELHGLYSGPWPEADVTVRREADYRKATELEITSHAVAGAYEVTETLSVGLGLAYFDGMMSAVTEAHGAYCGPAVGPCPGGFYELRPMVPANLLGTASFAITGTDLGFTAGFLWRFSERWKLGGSWRQGPGFDLGIEVRTGPAYTFAPAGTLLGSDSDRIKLPDVFGLGLAYRTSGQRFTLSLEWDRVEYGDLVDEGDELVIDNGNELHLGAEYVFLQKTPIAALRVGVWSDPAHRFGYQGSNYTARAVLPPGDDEIHFAAGLGMAFRRMQVDLGVDLSDALDTVSLSAIYFF